MEIRVVTQHLLEKKRAYDESLGITEEELASIENYDQYKALCMSHGALGEDVDAFKDQCAPAIEKIMYHNHEIDAVKWRDSSAEWRSIYSCFAAGYWINENPWTDDLGWAN